MGEIFPCQADLNLTLFQLTTLKPVKNDVKFSRTFDFSISALTLEFLENPESERESYANKSNCSSPFLFE